MCMIEGQLSEKFEIGRTKEEDRKGTYFGSPEWKVWNRFRKVLEGILTGLCLHILYSDAEQSGGVLNYFSQSPTDLSHLKYTDCIYNLRKTYI